MSRISSDTIPIAQSVQQDYSNAALECSTRVLRLNPEFQSGWSARRRILIGGVLQNV